MLRNRLAKIVATLGPETGSAEAMRSLYEAGADVFRINAAYSDDDANAALVRLVQDTIADPSDPVGTLWDLPGLKMRIGDFADGAVALEPGGTFTLDQSPEPGDAHRVYLPFPEAFAHSRVGDLLRLDDGRLTLRVTEVTLYRLTTEVVAGGVLSANKAILFPNVPVPTAEVSARDAESLTAALEAGVDWVAATANGSLAVVQDFRRRVGDRAKLMIKIDSQALLDQLDAVLELADGLFLARGDLGSSIPVERIPNAQKDCILAARRAGKPVVVAAQMLESMVSDPTPTRAEASDVCQAIYDGADAVTLSAETAVGHYPTDAVAMMDRLIVSAEADDPDPGTLAAFSEEDTTESRVGSIGGAIAHAAVGVARELGASAIVVHTSSGSTARRVARLRPGRPILCLTDSAGTRRAMTVVCGVHPLLMPSLSSWKEIVEVAVRATREQQLGDDGDVIAITAGMPLGASGSTNILRVATL